MRYSEFVAKLVADLEANGDAENVSIGICVPDPDGTVVRLDAVFSATNTLDILRDSNYVNGMVCIAADHLGHLANQSKGLGAEVT